jgi:hypothetical protein
MLELFLHLSADSYDFSRSLRAVLDSEEAVEVEECGEVDSIGIVVQVNSFALELWT